MSDIEELINYINNKNEDYDKYDKNLENLLISLDTDDNTEKQTNLTINENNNNNIKQKTLHLESDDDDDDDDENNDEIIDSFQLIYEKYFNNDFNKVCDNKLILNQMFKRQLFVNIQSKLLGCSRARYINKFNLEKPEIELCDIIDFIHTLKSIRPKHEYAVYIDLCQNSKFYVGISHSSYLETNIEITDTNLAKSRLADHRNNGGTIFQTNFTHMYPVISTLCCFFGDKDDENLITILMYKCVGNNVRGGDYASPFLKLPDFSNISIDEIKHKLLHKILKT